MLAKLNWLDIAALIVIAFCSIEGLLKGLVLSVFNMAGFIAAILIAKATASGFAEYITANTSIDDTINKYLVEKYYHISSGVSPALKMLGDSKSGFENTLTTAIILMLSFVLIFIAVKTLLSLAANILDTAAKLPVIKHFNRLGGFIFGALKGICILYIVFALITLVMPLTSPDNLFATSLGSSVFASNFYIYNFIIPWIKGRLFYTM